jgi:Na+/melibiose symporter-like transporter
MDKVRSYFQLLGLFSIFFIYKAIMGVIENNMTEVTFWILITIVYIFSLIILYFVIKRWEKRQQI